MRFAIDLSQVRRHIEIKHLLTLKLFQTCMSLFLLLKTKDNLKNIGKQTVDGSRWFS